MFNRIEIGINPNHLKEKLEKELQSIPQTIIESAYRAADQVGDENQKAVNASVVLIQKILPTVITQAVNENNLKLAKAFEELTREIREMQRRR